jgi:hypothetical protein
VKIARFAVKAEEVAAGITFLFAVLYICLTSERNAYPTHESLLFGWQFRV